MLTSSLWPLAVGELKRRGPSHILDWALSQGGIDDLPNPPKLSRDEYIEIMLEGGFPEIRTYPLRPRQRAYRAYIDAVVDRDVADLLRIRKNDALRRLSDQIAIRTGGELNLNEIAELIGIRRSTLEQYLNILTRLSFVHRLGAWTSVESRREVKKAKFHCVDTGLVAALRYLSPNSFDLDKDPSALGGLLESFVFGELFRSAPFQCSDFRFYHWRDNRGREIDILAESGNNLIAFEVKASMTINAHALKNLKWFSEEGPAKRKDVSAIIFYLGSEKLTFGNHCFALPVSMLWAG